ncbi:MAG: alanine--tRNA ligase [Parcubacteria group bacterium CG11_big_fil_rev_8_21_14_0_20_39_22]|nr:MAG: alanine--tRNA ligase [Parcubacteria group bacterium CG11_big_fil_rev_8_21_14_0_20_39_22]
MSLKLQEVREKYISFFKKRGHSLIPSASLLPENDPTTLFTGSGMQPLIPYLLGETHPKGRRLVNSQKSFRAEDIDEVGDNRHTTFFEMLGNWSLGDYFKDEQLPWVFEFLTDEIKIDPKRLYVTVFAGDEKNSLPKDTESVDLWKDLFKKKGIEAEDVFIGTEEEGSKKGMQGGRIFYYSTAKNWWSRSGVPESMPSGEPGGPDSEIFYDFGTEHDSKYGEHCHPNCDCGRFMEIGNSVFMEYVKNENSGFDVLYQKNVDFGGGLERITAAANHDSDVFKIDALRVVIDKLEQSSDKKYEDPQYQKSFRIVADHMRAALFLIADGVSPSNTEQGYFSRRLIRRAIRHLDILGIGDGGICIEPIISSYSSHYDNLSRKSEEIRVIFKEEEEKFRKTLSSGLKEFDKISSANISGEHAFVLFSTYGFPIDMTLELADEKGIVVDIDGFNTAFKEHQEKSRIGAEKKFKGGLADTSEMSIKYHTATHLLGAALREVVGDSVMQKGSNITSERMRFDFSHNSKLTDEEKTEVEKIVNDKIREGLPVVCSEMPLDVAREKGAIGVFGDKYSDVVKVYSIGDEKTGIFSMELCGGPHVTNTNTLGNFKILKEEAVSQGVRRIKAVLE